ncbi:MAG: MBL fold metallo-hydrolase [Deltaproteobacteria bacterium]|nr:MBL fold metallo-hydrolase [Deltaproteobacteria bacterium]
MKIAVDKLEDNLYRIKVPLSGIPLGYVNSYVIKDGKKGLMIDTGLNRNECLEVIQNALSYLKIQLDNLDLFITHFHSDHIGLVGALASPKHKIYLGSEEIKAVRNFDGHGFSFASRYMIGYGFPAAILDQALNQLLAGGARSFAWRPELNLIAVRDGDQIAFGPYSFLCVHTPGHSPGHTCLYEPKKRMLFAGDHILCNITPSVGSMSDDTNPLISYLKSLEKVKALDIDIILPGHRRAIRSPDIRIQELINHHKERCDEILDILTDGPKDAYHVATGISWDLPYSSWKEVPESQKWFATAETIAHLRYMETKGIVRRDDASGEHTLFFKL